MYPVIKLLAVLSVVAVAREVGDCTKPKISLRGALRDEKRTDKYHVRKGYSLVAYCSSDSNDLVLTEFGQLYSTVKVNATTIKSIVETKCDKFWLKCTWHGNSSCSHSVMVLVSYYPKITELNCFSNNLDSLNCSWITHSRFNDYKLKLSEIHLHESGGFLISRICQGVIDVRKYYYSCLWDLHNIVESPPASLLPNLSLLLLMCSTFDCVNETRIIDLTAVTILSAPELIRIQPDYTDGTILEWRVPFGAITDNLEIFYKVEFWFPGIQPRLIITETTTAQRYQMITTHVTLQCPDKQYTVRVSCRPTASPAKYVSEFGYISFETKPDTGAKALDPICDADPVEENPPVMKYQTQLLRKDVRKKFKEYRDLMASLKEKAALINKLILSNDRNV